jgi:hypothetical protein
MAALVRKLNCKKANHRTRRKPMKRSLWTPIWIVAATITCSAQNTSYFPQIADGQAGGTAWTTVIAVTNPAATGTSAATGTITFTQDNGTPFNIVFTTPQGPPVGSGNTISFQLTGGQTSYFVSTGAGALTVGFGTVTSSLPVTAGAVFQENANSPNGPDIAQAGVAAVAPLTRQAVFVRVNKKGGDTGVAIANPGTATANITFQLLDTNGVATGSAINTTLAAMNHTAKFVSQLFPSVAGLTQFLGTMQITSQTPLVSTGLIFNSDGTFATIPVITLASLFNPAIEWPDQRPWRNPLESLARLVAGLQFKLC